MVVILAVLLRCLCGKSVRYKKRATAAQMEQQFSSIVYSFVVLPFLTKDTALTLLPVEKYYQNTGASCIPSRSGSNLLKVKFTPQLTNINSTSSFSSVQHVQSRYPKGIWSLEATQVWPTTLSQWRMEVICALISSNLHW